VTKCYPSWTISFGTMQHFLGVVKQQGTDAWLLQCGKGCAHTTRKAALACARNFIKNNANMELVRK
jgi:hypothetical protein